MELDSSSSDNKREKNIEWPTNGMDLLILPRELILDILSRLPITSLIRFSYVSKSCHKLSSDPHLVSMHLAANNNTTCLIFHSGYPYRNQLHFVEFSNHNDNDKQIVRRIQPPPYYTTPTLTPMPEFNVVGSSNGLICLSNSINHDSIHIFNPFTRSYKQLPESRQFNNQKVLVGFGFHPLTNEYKVVRIVYHQNVDERLPRRHRNRLHDVYSHSEVQVYSVGSNHWRCIGNMPCQIERRASQSLLVNGRLHWLTRSGYGGGYAWRIVSFDLADEQFRDVPTPDFGGIKTYPHPLAVLQGCLSAVVYHRLGNMEIWVMKEYGVRDSWSKDFEIDVNDSNPSGPHLWSTPIQSLAVRALCQTKNGGVLLVQDGALASYDPESRELKNVTFEGMPNSFQAIVHVGSLVWIENV